LTTLRAKISAIGTYLPPRVLTNADLEKMVDTTNEWIMERVGIRERHIADKGVAASDLAVAAVKNLLESHPFDLQEVDLIIVGTVTPDMMYPLAWCSTSWESRIRGDLTFRRDARDSCTR
jgi:3-oxoacyl-[acyl-carrier-protein] synthase-3